MAVSGLDPQVQLWLLDKAYALAMGNAKPGTTVGSQLDAVDEVLDKLYKSVIKDRK